MTPSDKIMPSVSLELGGRQRSLVIDFNAQAAFEEATGLSIFDKKVLTARPSPRVVRAMVWAALLHDDEQVRFDEFGRMTNPPELTVTAVGNLITRHNVNEAGQKAFKAFQLFFKDEAEGDPAKKNE
jgi:hypothetical protein